MLTCARQDEAELAKFLAELWVGERSGLATQEWIQITQAKRLFEQGRLTAEVYSSALPSNDMRRCHQHLCASKIAQLFADEQSSQSSRPLQALVAAAVGGVGLLAGSVLGIAAAGFAVVSGAAVAAVAAGILKAAGASATANRASRMASYPASPANAVPAPDADDESNLEPAPADTEGACLLPLLPVSVSLDYICDNNRGSAEEPTLLVMLKYDGDMFSMSDHEVARFSARVKKTVITQICNSELNHNSLTNAYLSSRVLTDCCPICMVEFAADEQLALCDHGHAFHESCQAEWDRARPAECRRCSACISGHVGRSFRYMVSGQSSVHCAPTIPQELQSCTPTRSEKEWESCIQVVYCGQGSVIVGLLVAAAAAAAVGGILYLSFYCGPSSFTISQRQRDAARDGILSVRNDMHRSIPPPTESTETPNSASSGSSVAAPGDRPQSGWKLTGFESANQILAFLGSEQLVQRLQDMMCRHSLNIIEDIPHEQATLRSLLPCYVKLFYTGLIMIHDFPGLRAVAKAKNISFTEYRSIASTLGKVNPRHERLQVVERLGNDLFSIGKDFNTRPDTLRRVQKELKEALDCDPRIFEIIHRKMTASHGHLVGLVREARNALDHLCDALLDSSQASVSQGYLTIFLSGARFWQVAHDASDCR